MFLRPSYAETAHNSGTPSPCWRARRQIRDVALVDEETAFSRRKIAGANIEKCRLAGARRAEQCQNSPSDREIGRLQRRYGAERSRNAENAGRPYGSPAKHEAARGTCGQRDEDHDGRRDCDGRHIFGPDILPHADRQCLHRRAGQENREHDLVERGHERKDRAADDPGDDLRQRYGSEVERSAPRPAAASSSLGSSEASDTLVLSVT